MEQWERKTPRLDTTLPRADMRFLDTVELAIRTARQRAGMPTRIGRAGILRGVIEGLRRLDLDFSRATSSDDIADLIAAAKKRTRK